MDNLLRPASARVRDWKEIYQPWHEPSALTEAKRCMDCGVPFCQSESGCPLGNRIPEWNALASDGRWEDALVRLHATNNFPEFTGRLCPAPCEAACVLAIHSESVTIKSLEWSIIQRGFERGWILPRPSATKSGRTVAIIGSGPAGLAAAQQLARAGHAVTVFEKQAQPGGLLRYGIPDFKFEKRQVERRIQQLEAEGVRFKTSVQVGKDLELAELHAEYDAVALTIGCEQPRDLRLPGRELQGIHFAMDYLVERNKIVSGESLAPAVITCADRDVVILGGGDTGSDCLGTALREGARSVRQIEVQARPQRVKTSHAHEEGGERQWSLTTKEFQGQEGHVQQLLTSNDEKIPAQVVLLAVGYAHPQVVSLSTSLQTDARGNIATDSDYATSVAGIFAAGDARRGASLIVWAIAEGRGVAASIEKFLRSK